MDGMGFDDEDQATEVVEWLKVSSCKDSLKFFSWGYDADEMNDLVKSLLNHFKEEFKALETISMAETLCGAKRRNKIRKEHLERGIKLILSDREKNESDEEGNDSEEDSDEESSNDGD